MATLLLDRGADVNAGAGEGLLHTPLEAAIESGNIELATLLLDWGADVNTQDAHAHTALYATFFMRDKAAEMIDLLLDRGADIEAADHFGQTPLLHAAMLGRAEAVQALLQRGANVKAKDKTGQNALQVAANPEVIALLSQAYDAVRDADEPEAKELLPRMKPAEFFKQLPKFQETMNKLLESMQARPEKPSM
jgi:ankyrin repeat protein